MTSQEIDQNNAAVTWGTVDLGDIEKARDEAKRGGEFFSFENGDNQVRILPPRIGEKLTVVTFKHFFVTVSGKKMGANCARQMSKGRCVVCEHAAKLKATGIQADYVAGDEMYAGMKSVWNVLDRAHPEAGVQMMQLGKKAHDALLAIIERESKRNIHMTDPYRGFDIIINKTGEKMQTTYAVSADRVESALAATDEEILQLVNDQPSLAEQLRITDEMTLIKALGAGSVAVPQVSQRIAAPPARSALGPAPAARGQEIRVQGPPPRGRTDGPPPRPAPRGGPPPPSTEAGRRPMRTAEDDVYDPK